ncbi:MAG: hemolysin family protein [bacterium]|nr:hemolysin family protein [bacterium]
MELILTVAIATLLASFLCSLFEAALYAVTPAQVELAKQQKRQGADRLARLRDDVEEPIAAILTINTVAHTVGAAWCGAMVAAAYGEDAVVWFATIFTVAVLVLTEIIPKSLGVRLAATFGPGLAWPLQVLTWIAWPIARPTRAAMRWLTGGHGPQGPSEDEVLVFSQLARRHGMVRGEEHVWVRNALQLDRMQVRELMTPRRVVEMLPATMTLEDAVAAADRWVHSRVPVHEEGDTDAILGVVYRREVFDAVVRARRGALASTATLAELIKPLENVPETMAAHELLHLFLERRRHLVGVVDEYGSFEGIVSLEDVLEALLGQEIVDEHDEIVDLQEHARRSNPHRDVEAPGPP